MSDLGIPQRFVDLAEQMGRQALSEAGLHERFGEPADVEIEVGQVWRARWEEVTSLLLVLAVEGREVHAAPVTIDPPAEDEHSLVVDDVATAFGVETTVWAGLDSRMPIRVLDRLIDVWNDDLVQWTEDAVQDRFNLVPAGARRGGEIRSELHPTALLRAELADDLEWLRQAPGLPVEVAGAAQRNLASLLGANVDLKSLCSALGLSQPEVMSLLRGQFPVTQEQVGVIARVTGLPGEDVADTTIPRFPLGLAMTIEHPRWRSTWTQRAQRMGVSEAEARTSGGYGVFSMAARETGSDGPNWDERLRQFLAGEEVGKDGA